MKEYQQLFLLVSIRKPKILPLLIVNQKLVQNDLPINTLFIAAKNIK